MSIEKYIRSSDQYNPITRLYEVYTHIPRIGSVEIRFAKSSTYGVEDTSARMSMYTAIRSV
ncbi:hypothetical protein [Horseradish latent virus]|uniref:Uncharacterized protein n=1 Tax=Horseradish latent virus TaxID=264076 RepID=K0DKX7_9VIRU|nr:hypothetical protein [Horseradish latent virus]AFT84154.1 hypothetical protein [Horseradish latent virus]